MGFSKEDLRAMTVKVANIKQIRKHLEKLDRKNDGEGKVSKGGINKRPTIPPPPPPKGQG